MALVTICIPAYRAAGFLVHTVKSALNQSCRDIVVAVAVEPPGADDLAACEPLLNDPRLRLRVNKERMGWDGNIRGMLRRVETPYFVILPHDDFLHERYVETLLAALERRPDASVAYGDIQFVSGRGFQRRFQALDDAPLVDRLASFLAAGANAPPWRGVTRSSVLDGAEFPTDRFNGFLVECEWAYHLLTRGPAIRVGQTLYFKRVFPDRGERASAIRAEASVEVRREALADHRQRLVSRTLAALVTDTVPAIIECGLDAVLAHWHLHAKLSADDPELQDRLRRAERACLDMTSGLASRILSLIQLAQSRIAEGTGDVEAALHKAHLAIASDDLNAHAHVHLARLLRARGDRFAALQAIARACDVDPYTINARDLGPRIEAEFVASVSA